MAKNLGLSPNLAHFGPNLVPNFFFFFFFFKNLASPVTSYYGQLTTCTVSEKTNDPILRKRSDRSAL